MFGFFDHFREVFSTIGKNPLRTVLTSFSIFWGIFILIILLAGGSGIQNKTLSGFKDDAVNSIWVSSGRTTIPHKGLPVDRRIQFSNRDYDNVQDVVPELTHVTARFQIRGSNQLVYKDKFGSYEIRSVHPDHKYLELTQIVRGRFINDLDLEEERKVIVVSKPIAEYIFENEEPIDKYVQVKGVPFKVIGVFTDEGGQWEENKVYVPITTAQKVFNGGDRIQRVMFTLPEDMKLDETIEIKERVRSYMANMHDFNEQDQRAVWINNNMEGFMMVKNLFLSIDVFIWFIGVLSLMAGIVGVSNIMMISVKERVKEIGIRKAIGATPWSVVNIIMQESIFITVIAGILGILAGYGVVVWVSSIIEENEEMANVIANPTVELPVILVALGFLTLFGTIAGLIPAVGAARIKPVEVLRED